MILLCFYVTEITSAFRRSIFLKNWSQRNDPESSDSETNSGSESSNASSSDDSSRDSSSASDTELEEKTESPARAETQNLPPMNSTPALRRSMANAAIELPAQTDLEENVEPIDSDAAMEDAWQDDDLLFNEDLFIDPHNSDNEENPLAEEIPLPASPSLLPLPSKNSPVEPTNNSIDEDDFVSPPTSYSVAQKQALQFTPSSST